MLMVSILYKNIKNPTAKITSPTAAEEIEVEERVDEYNRNSAGVFEQIQRCGVKMDG